MLPLLKKLWNWLKSLFIGSPKASNPKKVQKSPPEPIDGEYEGILMGLFEQVAAGTTTGGLRGWLHSRHCDDKKLVRWLGVKSEEWLRHPEDYQTLAQDLAALGKVMTGNLGEVSQRISLQLRDAVRDVSSKAWYSRGIALVNLGRYEEAIASYDQALEFKPDYHEAWYSRGWDICSLSKNRISTPSLEALIYPKPILDKIGNPVLNCLDKMMSL